MLKLIIFDFDGTIADTKEGILETVNVTLNDFGFPYTTGEKLFPLIGLPLEDIFSKVLPKNANTDIQALTKHYRKIYNTVASPKTKMFPGMRKTLEPLSKRGIVLAVATSKKREGVMRMLEALGISHLFPIVLSDDLVKNKKPFPDMVESILSKTKIEKHNALVVGDSIYDIRMGKNAGVKTCAVTYGTGSRTELLKEKPDIVIHKISALPGAIGVERTSRFRTIYQRARKFVFKRRNRL